MLSYGLEFRTIYALPWKMGLLDNGYFMLLSEFFRQPKLRPQRAQRAKIGKSYNGQLVLRHNTIHI